MSLERCANSDKIKDIVEYLCYEIGPRPISHPKILSKTRDFIVEKLEELGLFVEFQRVLYKGNEYFNIISGIRPSLLANSSCPLLVIGAHYDTVSTTPGADDNSSGVSGLLELARILSKKGNENLRFVFFCNEEPPCYRTKNMGSYWYAKHLKKIGQSLLGMICLEMIGYFSDRPKSQSYPFPLMDRIYPQRGNFIAMVGNIKSRDFTLSLKNAFKKHTSLPVESLNAPSFVIGIDFSDHWSFNKMGYFATMITDTAFYRNPHYHRPTDLPHTLDYKRAAMVIDGLAGAIIEFLQQKRHPIWFSPGARI